MRAVETLLVLANVLTFMLILFPASRTRRMFGYAVGVAVILVLAQIVIEGTRWQLFPAYALTILFSLVWSIRKFVFTGTLPKVHRFNRLLAGSAVGLGTVALAISIALPTFLPVFTFPIPSGPYAIGTVTYHWTDPARREVFGTVPHRSREMMVQIWYPAKQRSSSNGTRYIDDAEAFSEAQARLHNLPTFAFKHLEHVRINASESVRVADAPANYPVLIFVEGITGYRQMNNFQVEALVSHGYIVVAIDQPYVAASVAFPGRRTVAGLSKEEMNPLIQQSIHPVANTPVVNGQAFAAGIIPFLAQDVVFALDRLMDLNGSDASGILHRKLDMQRIGIFGISLGGIVVAEACRLDPRLKACLVMDAPMPATVLRSGLQQPSMWITRGSKTMQSEGWTDTDIVQHQVTMRTVFERSHGEGYFVSVAGMFHADLTDVPLYSPLTSRLGITGPINGQRAHVFINAYSLAFFDRHLRGKPARLLDPSTKPFSEVTLESKKP